MSRIGILTWHYYNNFGSVLQAYALQTIIQSLGYKCDIINYRVRDNVLDRVKDYVKLAAAPYLRGRLNNNTIEFALFRKNHLNETIEVNNRKTIEMICKRYDTIICGSDQIWAPNVFNSVYFLDFVYGKTKKCSYAASIGLDELPMELIEKYSCLLSSFDCISVREKQGQSILRKQCNIDSQVVLDPTLLIDTTHYETIFENCNITYNKPFAFCYFLNPDHIYSENVQEECRKSNFITIGVSRRSKDGEWMELVNNIGPEEFLWYIKNASIVYTDSYHGSIFSLLFHKKLVVFERFSDDSPISQNSRIRQLVDWFGIEDCIRKSKGKKFDSNTSLLDYGLFEEKLGTLREESFSYLKEALKC